MVGSAREADAMRRWLTLDTLMFALLMIGVVAILIGVAFGAWGLLVELDQNRVE
jgi:hypothetical protein